MHLLMNISSGGCVAVPCGAFLELEAHPHAPPTMGSLWGGFGPLWVILGRPWGPFGLPLCSQGHPRATQSKTFKNQMVFLVFHIFHVFNK